MHIYKGKVPFRLISILKVSFCQKIISPSFNSIFLISPKSQFASSHFPNKNIINKNKDFIIKINRDIN